MSDCTSFLFWLPTLFILFSIFVCVGVVCICFYSHVCSCVYGTEVDRQRRGESASIAPPPLFIDAGFLNQAQSLQTCLSSLASLLWGRRLNSRGLPHPAGICTGSECLNSVSILPRQALSPPSHLPIPVLVFVCT